MKTLTHLLLRGTATLAVFLGACGPNLTHLSDRSQSEAQTLQRFAAQAGVKSPEIAKANGLLESSNALAKDGKILEARQSAEQASGFYMVALARADKAQADQNLAVADSALAKDKERLGTYHEILDEMKTMRKP